MADSGYPIGIISIHALREESDATAFNIGVRRGKISIHALREESDSSMRTVVRIASRFQSTLSVRRATDGVGVCAGGGHFNPRSP